jgi:hypothetical protein
MAQLFVFIPSFRGNISALTFETSHHLMSTLFGNGIKAAVATYSWPDIAELRNMVLSVWYDTMKDSTHILFVDDDMGFPPELITEMVEFDEPVVGAIYPKKTTPRVWCGSGIEAAEYRKGFIEVEAVGAGILLIRRDAIDKMIEAYPDLINDYMATEDMKAAGGTRTMRFFDQLITDAGKAGEDISFCRRWGKIGGTVWASTSYTIQHVGPWTFSGCFGKEREAEARMKRDSELYASKPVFLKDDRESRIHGEAAS